ncbi:hypothetical protein BC941DRAFT_471039 [Chlamydoabsidia padenii]|nr:hypothetical protein BC941DRAFT_471039 [Chlamydoabsidia padenii]
MHTAFVILDEVIKTINRCVNAIIPLGLKLQGKKKDRAVVEESQRLATQMEADKRDDDEARGLQTAHIDLLKRRRSHYILDCYYM